MNMAHAHLILNHLPVLATAFGLIVFILARVFKNESYQKLSLWIFIVCAATAGATMITGDKAESIALHLPDVTEQLIEAHEEAAEGALVASLILGAFSVAGLWVSRKSQVIPGWMRLLLLLTALVSTSLMIRTARLGGFIRHTEIRSS